MKSIEVFLRTALNQRYNLTIRIKFILFIISYVLIFSGCEKEEVEAYPYPIKEIGTNWELNLGDSLKNIKIAEGKEDELILAGLTVNSSVALYMVDENGKIKDKFLYEYGANSNHSNLSLCYDSKSNIILGHKNKIFKINENGEVIKEVQLPSNILSIKEYQNGYLIIFNNYAVYRVDYSFKTIWIEGIYRSNSPGELLINENQIVTISQLSNSNSTDYDLRFIKANSSGDITAQKDYSDGTSIYIEAICASGNKNEYAALTTSGTLHSTMVWVPGYILFDEYGNAICSEIIDYNDIRGQTINPYQNGYLVGLIISYSQPETRLFHISEDGKVQWQSVFYNRRIEELLLTSNDGYIMVSESSDDSFVVSKLDIN